MRLSVGEAFHPHEIQYMVRNLGKRDSVVKILKQVRMEVVEELR